MIRITPGALAALSITCSASAGTFVFSPSGATVDNSRGPVPLEFELRIGTPAEPTIRSFDALIGSDSLQIDGFSFAPGIATLFPLNSIANPASPPVYADDVTIGGFAFTSVDSTDLLLGTLLVTVPQALEPGTYRIQARDGYRPPRDILCVLGPCGTDLTGELPVQVVPEPAAGTALLCLAAAALAGRKRRSTS